MNVLGHVHQAPPDHNAGSELMMLTILRLLAERGHSCRLLTDRGRNGELHGVDLLLAGRQTPNRYGVKSAAHRWADVVLTHLTATYDAVKHAKRARNPLVHLVHNDWQLSSYRVTDRTCQLAVLNSEWLADEVAWPHRQVIVRPPVQSADYRTTPGDHVTLVNLSDRKGADTFYALAQRADQPFLGVIGGHSPQDIRDVDNVEIVEHTTDMRAVYSRTRVVLMPSIYESWGRVAIEAAASGIPTIAHPTPGLRESLGVAGFFADRDDIDAWSEHLDRLDDADTYSAASTAAVARAEHLDAQATEDLDALEQALLALP